jgi:hypothetical protein
VTAALAAVVLGGGGLALMAWGLYRTWRPKAVPAPELDLHGDDLAWFDRHMMLMRELDLGLPSRVNGKCYQTFLVGFNGYGEQIYETHEVQR